jgi:hypothetical protein
MRKNDKKWDRRVEKNDKIAYEREPESTIHAVDKGGQHQPPDYGGAWFA